MPGSARAASESPQSPQTPAPAQSGRALAIDATALGAMTAGQIRVISTDAGMGVNLQGPLLAYQRDVEIQSAGRVSTGSLASARRSEEHTSELQSPCNLVCRLLLEKKKEHK